MAKDCIPCLLNFICPEHPADSKGENKSIPEIQSLRKGHMLFHQEAPHTRLYYIMEGVVKLYSLCESGKKMIHALVSSGDFVGIHALAEDCAHSHSAEVLEDAKVICLKANMVRQLVSIHPPVADLLINRLAKAQSEAYLRNLELIQSGVRERLARCLLDLADSFGEHHKTSVRIRLQLNREELASMIGVAPETAIRFISDFKKQNLITEEKHQIIILNHENLKLLFK